MPGWRALHLTANAIAKKGWNQWRQSRIERQRELGFLPDGWTPAPMPGSIPDWKNDPHKTWQVERMSVYAAQITNVDRGVGQRRMVPS